MQLLRSKVGRSLSNHRYQTSEQFLEGLQYGLPTIQADTFYFAGVVAQLALSAHLLDVGFADQWCAKHIGLHISKGLAYANATGLGHGGEEMARLAEALSPYWKWNAISRWNRVPSDDGGFACGDVIIQLRMLLDRVSQITGHPRRRKRLRSRLSIERSKSVLPIERA
jgi:hypothetical protein